MSDSARPRFTIRQLPLPAKLVVTLFLISVGVGYFSAMVQIHMQHSARDGSPMPTGADIVEKFSGLKRPDPDAKPPQSKIELLISGAPHGEFNKNNMAPAFYDKSASDYKSAVKDEGQEVVDARRATEVRALVEWCRSDADAKKAAWDADNFPTQVDKESAFFNAPSKGVAIKSLVEERCGTCHAGQQKPSLASFAEVLPLATAPTTELIDGQWVRSSKQITVEGLTQSTHAHLLSFTMLFSLTGLVFAFTSYPAPMRAILGPLVLVAQLADISCWWLARLDTVGPTFALLIMGTGGAVGVGLAMQLVASLFDLYGPKGKAVMAGIFLTGAVAFGALVVTVIEPTLKAERLRSEGEVAPAQ